MSRKHIIIFFSIFLIFLILILFKNNVIKTNYENNSNSENKINNYINNNISLSENDIKNEIIDYNNLDTNNQDYEFNNINPEIHESNIDYNFEQENKENEIDSNSYTYQEESTTKTDDNIQIDNFYTENNDEFNEEYNDSIDEENNSDNNKLEPSFDINTILVNISEERSSLNKEYTLDEFSEVELISITDNNINFGGQDYLVLNLKDPSSENVLNGIELLKKNPIVSFAEPNYITSID